MKRCILLVAALVLGLSRSHSAEPANPSSISLAKTLSPEEFARAGLNKLTPEELAFLDATLASKSLSPVAVAATVPARASTPASSAKRPAAQPASTPSAPLASAPEATSDFGAEQISKVKPTSGPDELHTTIEGTVQEFSGRAVFVLANGQVWQQRTPQDVFLSKKLVNPAVTLIRTSLGYKMLIDAANVVVFVKRIQ